MPVQIITDSTAYIDEKRRAELGIEQISLYINDAGSSIREVDINQYEFYERLKDLREIPKSAQPAPEEIIESYKRALAEGKDVLAIFLSALMSGTVQSAEMLALQVMEEFPGAKIVVLDSESNSQQTAFAVESAALAAQKEASLEECVSAAQNTMQRSRFIFAPKSLEYLTRGGRIGKASSLVGSVLKIIPILTVEEGVTTTLTKVRTFPKALIAMRDKLVEDIELGGGLKRICIHAIAESSIAQAFKKDLIDPLLHEDVDIVMIGPVIGAHVGPAVGLVYETNNPIR